MPIVEVAFRSFEDVRDFVFLASAQPYDITIGSESYRVDAKSMMVMLSLDYSRPLQVRASCDQEEMGSFLEAIRQFCV